MARIDPRSFHAYEVVADEYTGHPVIGERIEHDGAMGLGYLINSADEWLRWQPTETIGYVIIASFPEEAHPFVIIETKWR